MTRYFKFKGEDSPAYPESVVDEAGREFAKPVVVIDPEDREQVERLADAVIVEAAGYRIDKAILTVGLGKGLREFANPQPPKPDEPTGLGAVVEDAEGRRWVRIRAAVDDPTGPNRDQLSPPWRRPASTAKWWDHVPAVRVVSQGVQS